jgi:hypothetical protein
VASLPFLQKTLDEMQHQQATQQQAPAPQNAAPGK